MALRIVDFGERWLDEAAHLLAARHRRQRASEPLLSPRFENPATARAEVEGAWRLNGASARSKNGWRLNSASVRNKNGPMLNAVNAGRQRSSYRGGS